MCERLKLQLMDWYVTFALRLLLFIKKGHKSTMADWFQAGPILPFGLRAVQHYEQNVTVKHNANVETWQCHRPIVLSCLLLSILFIFWLFTGLKILTKEDNLSVMFKGALSWASRQKVKSHLQNTYSHQWKPKNNGPVLLKITILVYWRYKRSPITSYPSRSLCSQVEKVGQTFFKICHCVLEAKS